MITDKPPTIQKYDCYIVEIPDSKQASMFFIHKEEGMCFTINVDLNLWKDRKSKSVDHWEYEEIVKFFENLVEVQK